MKLKRKMSTGAVLFHKRAPLCCSKVGLIPPAVKWPPCWLSFSESRKKIQARIAAQTQSGAAKAAYSDGGGGGGGGGGVSGSGARRGQQKHKDIIRETAEMSRRRVNTHTARLH